MEDDELPDLSRLARADGDRARPPVQALHRAAGPAACRGADGYTGPEPGRGRDLLRSGPSRLLLTTYRPPGRGGPTGLALVRPHRVDGLGTGAARNVEGPPGGTSSWPSLWSPSWSESWSSESAATAVVETEPAGGARSLAAFPVVFEPY